MVNDPRDKIRAREVLKLTGWDRKYLHKLRRAGRLTVWQPYASAWPWYSRREILDLIGCADNGKDP
jgi:hypothetical protein